jgi:hypothetical protein
MNTDNLMLHWIINELNETVGNQTEENLQTANSIQGKYQKLKSPTIQQINKYLNQLYIVDLLLFKNDDR